jgi:hypothetical protein
MFRTCVVRMRASVLAQGGTLHAACWLEVDGCPQGLTWTDTEGWEGYGLVTTARLVDSLLRWRQEDL